MQNGHRWPAAGKQSKHHRDLAGICIKKFLNAVVGGNSSITEEQFEEELSAVKEKGLKGMLKAWRAEKRFQKVFTKD
ncbi:hypothetical protein LTR85_006233 [Meristemomyces frigidus]|nr:hypothetical protein LTR85_006233 [Meristemomyces frigidus]